MFCQVGMLSNEPFHIPYNVPRNKRKFDGIWLVRARSESYSYSYYTPPYFLYSF